MKPSFNSKPSWGKVRVGAIAVLGAVAISAFIFFSAAPRAYSDPPGPTIFVTNLGGGSGDYVTAYPAASNGDVFPLDPAPTGLSNPQAVAIDSSGNIYVANGSSATINIYAAGSNGSVAPIAIIGGSNTGIYYPPGGVALDSSGKIYVTNSGSADGAIPAKVLVYPPLASLPSQPNYPNVAPLATISGGNTGLSGPQSIAVDSSDKIYVLDSLKVFVYPALGSSTGVLDEFPTARISGSNTGLNEPNGIAVDSSSNIYVANNSGSVLVYSAGSSGNIAPIATISSSSNPYGIVVDPSGKIYVTNEHGFFGESVLIYAALGSSTGTLNEAPIATISGSGSYYGIALDSSGKIYVEGLNPSRVAVYPSLVTSGLGTLNEAPIATIGGVNTGLDFVEGIAVDSVGNVYVANSNSVPAASVSVYAAGSNGNAAPIATISGSNTFLSSPYGIAVDSTSGKIFVTDFDAKSVFVFPALGSSTGTLDEFPIAGINGANTGLSVPEGVALDSSSNIYVANNTGDSVTVYAAGSNGNIAPLATISGSNTSLESPQGVALDSSGRIYVTEFEDVLVFPALVSSGTGLLNEAPLATISGSNTSLEFPQGIAVDSSGNIYVADAGNIDLFQGTVAPSVFVYPPLGSSTGVLDEFPSATISGLFTGLTEPQFLAIGPGVASPTATPTASLSPTATVSPTATASSAVTPTATHTAAPTVTRTATPTPTITATRTATPTATSTVTATSTATPSAAPTTSLSAAPPTLSFGNVDATGTSAPKKVTLTNKGKVAAQISSVTATAPFMIAGGANTCSGNTVAPKKTCVFDVEFAPPMVANVSAGSINVTYNGSRPAVNLQGNGVAVTLTSPSREAFSSVAKGSTGKPKGMKIANPGTVGVSLGATTIGGTNSASFKITANTCTNTLARKPGSCTITMEFAPGSGATGTQSATVGFNYTYGANSGSVSIPISGTVK